MPVGAAESAEVGSPRVEMAERRLVI